MSRPETCSGASDAAGEALAGTATQGGRWLIVELRGAWGRDAVADTDMPPGVRAQLDAFDGKVILARRPDRRRGVTVFRAEVSEGSSTVVAQQLESLEQLPLATGVGGEPVAGPLVLVCVHGRRDACCARLGLPLFTALSGAVPPGRLWQVSHLGGHRFAPNVLVLPHGVQLGRIPLDRALEVAALLEDGRIPLDLYRGRTLYAPAVQAAEIAARRVTGCDGFDEVRLLSHDGALVTFATAAGELTIRVEERAGPSVPASCGADAEPTKGWLASLESAA